MTELIVVISIIALLLAAAMPSLSSTWQQRKAANAETLVRGAVLSARMKGLGNAERGLFFMVDNNGQQLVFDIVAKPFDSADPLDAGPPVASESAAANRYEVQAGPPLRLPSPYRVMPRNVVDTTGGPKAVWTAAELANNTYDVAVTDPYQRHRNFFTIIFNSDGQLRVKRDVIIHDPDVVPLDGIGDLTELAVAATNQWYDQGGPVPLNPASPPDTLMAVVVETGPGIAISFPSVDGLLVYDDSLFNELPAAADKRDFLLSTAQPLYISRLSGQVIRGPLGENK